MHAKQRQLEASLQQHGWRVIERRRDGLEWWADAVWVVESEWSPHGTRAYLTFLVDPQWEGPRQAGVGVWALAASSSLPSSRLEAETHKIAIKRWDEQLSAFVSEMAVFRGDARTDIKSLINAELDRVNDPAQRGRLQSLLQPPMQMSLLWAYGQQDERFDCWKVGQSPDGRIIFVYCALGFGPDFPWGFIGAGDASMGMDSQWHSGLEDVAICAAVLPTPPGYESPGPRSIDFA